MSDSWKNYFIQSQSGGAQTYRAAMNQCVDMIAYLLENTKKPYSGSHPIKLQQFIDSIDLSNKSNLPLNSILYETCNTILKNNIIVQLPGCIAHLHTPPIISGLIAENIISAQNLSMDSWDQSGAATFLEQRVVKYLCELFGYENAADGVFTSGGTQSNIMALLMARDSYIQKKWNINPYNEGLPSEFGKMRILTSSNSHFTVEKAAIIMGLGRNAVVKIESLPNGEMNIDALKSIIDEMNSKELLPFCIVGTAGTTDHGAIDDLYNIGVIAIKHDLWFHVDAAYGSALITSEKYKKYLSGIDLATSITVDFHKLWFQPISCSALLVKDGQSFKHFLYNAPYLNRQTDTLPNLVDKTISTTRRFDALKIYMLLKIVGVEELGRMIDYLIDITLQINEKIKRREKFTVIADSRITTILFHYNFTKSIKNNELNRKLRISLLEQGEVILGETIIGDQVALKLTILNPCLTINDIERIFDTIESYAKIIDK